MREIFLQNTLSGKKEKFIPLKSGEVRIYCCGPTVYGYTHVGNARAALTLDLVRRIFRLAGYKVLDASNYTDVDDKIIKRANEEGVTAEALAETYTKAYDEDVLRMGNDLPKYRPKATEHIQDMLQMIQKLKDKGLAYVADTPYGKDVYFRVANFPSYGKLSKRSLDDMQAGARIEVGEAKENPLDFALWKAAKPGEPQWPGPYGAGRPGWHIECSAMIQAIFPEGLDIHMGGLDLIFPHHENEIAQSEGANEHPLARYWLHNNMLVIGREKMSKSLGNIFTTRQFLDEHGGEVLRLLLLQQHYRSPVDFSADSVLRTEGQLLRLYHCKQKALQHSSAPDGQNLPEDLQGLAEKIELALFDDFNSAKALGFIFKAARVCFREDQPSLWKQWAISLSYLDQVFGLLKKNPTEAFQEMDEFKKKRLSISQDKINQIERLLQQRNQFRAVKDYASADRIRDELNALSVQVMDGPDGTSWTLQKRESV